MGSGYSILYQSQISQTSFIEQEIISYNSTNLPFDVISNLGKGGYSTVYHGIDHDTKRNVAIKQTNIANALSHGGIEFIFNELNVFQRIGSHDFIVNLHLAFRTHDYCYLVMDCLRGGDLRQILKRYNALNETSVIYIVGCIGSALNYLHRRGIIHRDVKPENISLDLWGRPKLIDFGISVASEMENPIPLCRTSSGTLCYLAPEVLTPRNIHSYQSDFWSLGAVAYELLYCRRLFEKHCPVYFVQFSANQFSHMWSRLEEYTDSASSIDFRRLWKDNISAPETLPFPTLGLSLNSDDSLPSSLVLFFPNCRPNSLEPLSDQCQSLLHGLLDVRIPYRLGDLLSFSEFSDHPTFHYHKYQISQLHLYQSPLVSCSYQPQKPPNPPNESQPLVIESLSAETMTYTKEIEDKLTQFYYMSPKRSHVKKKSTVDVTGDTIFSKIIGRC